VSRGVIWDVKGLASGESRGGGPAPLPLFWVKKEEITEGKKKKTSRESKTKPPSPPPLAQGLGPPLLTATHSLTFF